MPRTTSLEVLSPSYLRSLLTANLHGQRCDLSPHKRNGRRCASVRDYHQQHEGVDILSDAELNSLRIRLYARYRNSGRFTRSQLTSIFRVLVLDWTFHRVAAMDDVSVQAVSERFFGNKHGQGGILRKAPELHELLCLRNPQLRTRTELGRTVRIISRTRRKNRQ